MKSYSNKLQEILSTVTLPGRYTGGEFGTQIEQSNSDFAMAISFPDLYEIGMSNNAVRVIYNLCNLIEGVTCERVFSPAPDFEELLRKEGILLPTLEFQQPLKELDLLAFTVGYELSATNILAILECGGIPIHTEKRGEEHPIVIAGGPAMTNPAPLGHFIDAVYIGEAEAHLGEIIAELRDMKLRNASRKEMIAALHKHPCIWFPEKKEITTRAIYKEFSQAPVPTYYPVPHIETAQSHGVVEVMRGCPNGCRFCQAGYFYRPLREKDIATIIQEIDFLVYTCGYQRITLTSLSTGDFSRLQELLSIIHTRYEGEKISFSLPSLKVNSFTLEIMKELSKVKKSGLTFAVETPLELWQKGINKEVSFDHVVSILKEAKNLGWNQAKFYFMIGLPPGDVESEVKEITAYIEALRAAIKINLSINVGTFIPKPHTPYQREPQLGWESGAILRDLKEHLKRPGIKISYHDPFVSYLEGVVARGDSSIGTLIEEAYHKGARLDAWSEYIQKDIWHELLEQHTEIDITQKIPQESALPWDTISIGTTEKFFSNEMACSTTGVLTAPCHVPCTKHCGVCNKQNPMVYSDNSHQIPEKPGIPQSDLIPRRVIAQFSKQGRAIYLSHINLMHHFEQAIFRIGAIPMYTQGFTPKPKIEFASPLSLGIESQVEVVSLYIRVPAYYDEEMVAQQFTDAMLEGLTINECILLPGEVAQNEKIIKLAPNYGGSDYEVIPPKGDPYTISSTATGKDQPGNPLKDAITKSGLDKITFLATHRVTRKNLYFKTGKAMDTLGSINDLFSQTNAK